MLDVPFRAAKQLAAKIRRKRFGCLELPDLHLASVKKYNPALNAIIATDVEGARIGADPTLDALPLFGQHASLVFLLALVDANMLHGWPPFPWARERVTSLWGTLCRHVEWGVSRFISSTLSPGRQAAALQLNRNMENENLCAKAKSLS